MAGDKPGDWLDWASASDLEAMAAALEDGRLRPPFAQSQFQQAGLSRDACSSLEQLRSQAGEVTSPALAWMLRRLARERRIAERRWADVARLVWSGPLAGHEPSRDTRQVLDEMFHRAERHVLLATYVIYDGPRIFRTLSARMNDRPDLVVDFYVNLPPTTGQDEAEDTATFVGEFLRDQWPRGARPPNLFYDPETRKRGHKRVTLHAKCVVVDERWAFVTSANFTEAAQDRNIEAGVLLDHPGLAGALAGRFQALREAGRMKQMADEV